MLNVFLTVDTEVWPLTPNWRQSGLERDIQRDLYGVTQQGAYGLLYHLELLARHNLKAVFFLEPLFSEAAGLGILRQAAREIYDAGQEIQLHLHPEWLAWIDNRILPGRTGENLTEFSEDEQAKLIAFAHDRLGECGVRDICAFRAGTYAANADTLRALARTGIPIDSSHNATYLGKECELNTAHALWQPRREQGVWEFPITQFSDWAGHLRHAQITACSFHEMRTALLQAHDRQWNSFVIVTHTFELLKRRRRLVRSPQADPIAIRRFEQLCAFLDANRDRFRTTGFKGMDLASLKETQPSGTLKGRLHLTAMRFAEQSVRRLY